MTRAFVVSLLGALLLAGCGSPRTNVYVENTDATPYIVIFKSDGFSPVSVAVAANSGALIFNEPADANGVVELHGTDCTALSTAVTSPGRVLVTVSSGAMKVESGADLSQKPPSVLAKAECP